MIVGVLGAGQLGRMLGLAAAPLGISVRFYDEPSPSGTAAPAACIGPVAHGRFDDFGALDRFSAGCDAITYEFENVPVAAAEHLAQSKPVWPPPAALRVAQDRVTEKTFYRDLGAGVPTFAPIARAEDGAHYLHRVGSPCVLKTRRMGYDGKGQAIVRTSGDLAEALCRLAPGRTGPNLDLIAEAFVPFAREVSILGVRGRDGAVAFYPLVQNRHQHGILAESVAPALGTTPAMQAHAQDIARRAMDRLGYVGVLAIELFELADGTLLVNEMAPRVHNSGHWTIEGAVTSQFENHMRAVAGLPLGSTAMVGDAGRGGMHAAMLNAVGRMPSAAAVLSEPDVHVHDYGKSGRPGRKVGHVTVRRGDYESLSAAIAHLRPLVPFEVEA